MSRVLSLDHTHYSKYSPGLFKLGVRAAEQQPLGSGVLWLLWAGWREVAVALGLLLSHTCYFRMVTEQKDTKKSHFCIFFVVIFNSSLPDMLCCHLVSLPCSEWKIHRDSQSFCLAKDCCFCLTLLHRKQTDIALMCRCMTLQAQPQTDTCPFFSQSSCWVHLCWQGWWKSSWSCLEPVPRAAFSTERKKLVGLTCPDWAGLLLGGLKCFWAYALYLSRWKYLDTSGSFLRHCTPVGLQQITVCSPQQTQVKTHDGALLGCWSWTHTVCYWALPRLLCHHQHFGFCLFRSLWGGQWALLCAHHLPGYTPCPLL